jgi:hypothetical protein
MAGIGKRSNPGQTADLRVTFDLALSDKRRYPVAEFKALVQSARRYIAITARDPMIHKSRSASSEWFAGVPEIGTKANSWRYLV